MEKCSDPNCGEQGRREEKGREGERMEEGWDRKGGRGERQSEWLTDALWLRFCPLSIGAASLFAGQRREWWEDAKGGGVQEEEIKMKNGEGTKRRAKVLVVKRKKQIQTREEGRKRVVMGRGTLTVHNSMLMGARPRLSGVFFPPLFGFVK